MIIELTGLNKRLDLNVEIPKEEEAKPIVPEEAFTITGDCRFRFGYGGWDWFIEDFGDRIKTENITNAESMFQKSEIDEIPFEINLNEKCESVSYFIQQGLMKKLWVFKVNDGKKVYPNMSHLFSSTAYFNDEITLDWFNQWLDFEKLHTSSSGGAMSGMFAYCYSLRKIDEKLLENLWSKANQYSACVYQGFVNSYNLDEIKGIHPPNVVLTSNMFSQSFSYNERVKDITFSLDNGKPFVRNWKNQAIDLGTNKKIGYTNTSGSDIKSYFQYTGITEEKEIKDAESYQALKNDEDSWTMKPEYSRYNKRSALNTIKSLPDCSSGSSNSIKFQGNAGSLTDEGAINTLTQEEIAIASAKGWTVAFG